jgi:hypothetical protein
MPPRIEAKEIGMRNFEAGSFMRRARLNTTGTNTTTTGVLLIQAETKATRATSRKITTG